MNNLLNKYDIKQVYISDSINFFSKYTKHNYSCKNKTTLFIGLYNKIDIETITKHISDKYIFWFNSECNPYFK